MNSAGSGVLGSDAAAGETRRADRAPGRRHRVLVRDPGRLGCDPRGRSAIACFGIRPVCDRLRSEGRDRRAFLAAGLVVAVPSLWMFYAASSITSLTLSYYALQVGMNVAIGPYQAVISDYIVPEGRGRASAWMVVFRALGNGCGLLVAGFVG